MVTVWAILPLYQKDPSYSTRMLHTIGHLMDKEETKGPLAMLEAKAALGRNISVHFFVRVKSGKLMLDLSCIAQNGCFCCIEIFLQRDTWLAVTGPHVNNEKQLSEDRALDGFFYFPPPRPPSPTLLCHRGGSVEFGIRVSP